MKIIGNSFNPNSGNTVTLLYQIFELILVHWAWLFKPIWRSQIWSLLPIIGKLFIIIHISLLIILFLQKSKQKNWEGMCLLLSPNTNWRRCTKPCSAFAAQCSVRAKSAVEADQSSANARLYLRTCTTVLLSCKLHTGWKSQSYSDGILRIHTVEWQTGTHSENQF